MYMLLWSISLRILSDHGLLNLSGTYSGARLSYSKRIMPLCSMLSTPSTMNPTKASGADPSKDQVSRSTLPGGEGELVA